ncbi:MAG: hypothetical protein H6712_00840 [Myxococcales bacterium]|nr:hypothetical protein [Myxococcales bacterium]
MILSIATRRLLVTSLGLGLTLAACGGDAKPAAKAPADAETKDGKGGEAGKNMGEIAKDGVAEANAGDKVKVVDGAAPGDERYALQIEPPGEASAGQAGEVVVRVVPKQPWHMNLDYPTSLKVEAPTGIALTKADLKKADARTLDAESCEFAVGFTPAEAGEHQFTGTFKFAVCQDEACSPVTEDVSFTVAVK